MTHFFGREEELKLLSGLSQKKSASLVVVYGRRRIGKSRLIDEFGKRNRFISFSGLYPEKSSTQQDQLNEFHRRFKEQFKDESQEVSVFKDWGDAFYSLAEKTRKGSVVILLDEISWMSWKGASFLGKLKNAWDMEFKKNDKLILVLCGSVSIWIEKNLIANQGFYGRISLKLKLRELSLRDCKKFWDQQAGKYSSYEILKVLAVTGGIPKYLEEIRADQSSDENIKRLCFLNSGLLYQDYDYIFSALLERDSLFYQKIVKTLIDGPKERQEIADKTGLSTGRVLTEYLEELVSAGFLARDYTWDLSSGTPGKLSRYRLSDNYLRFYLKYIFPNIPKIKNDQFSGCSLGSLPAWSSIVGLQIENLILNNREIIRSALGIYPDELVCDGPYYQRPTARKQGCQIDYLIQTKFGLLYLIEVKFSRGTLRGSVIQEVQEKISRLGLPKNYSVKPVLIYLGELADEILDSQYFAKTIDMATLFL